MKLLGKLVYKIVWVLTHFVAYVLYPHKVIGKKNANIHEPYIFCANHISMLDPIILVGSVMSSKTYFMGKDELYKTKLSNWFFRSLGSFPVKRGSADMGAIKSSIEHIKSGGNMIIFPEGTRNINKDGKLMKLHNGVGIVSLKTSCKIIPCYIDCKGGYKMFRKFKIKVGSPIDTGNFAAKGLKKDNLNSLMELVREKIESLM